MIGAVFAGHTAIDVRRAAEPSQARLRDMSAENGYYSYLPVSMTLNFLRKCFINNYIFWWLCDLAICSTPRSSHHVCGRVTVRRIGFHGRWTEAPNCHGRYGVVVIDQLFLETRGGPRGFTCHFARYFVMVDDGVLQWPLWLLEQWISIYWTGSISVPSPQGTHSPCWIVYLSNRS